MKEIKHKKIIITSLFFFIFGLLLLTVRYEQKKTSLPNRNAASVILAQNIVNLSNDNSLEVLTQEFYANQAKIGAENARVDLSLKQNKPLSPASSLDILSLRSSQIEEELSKKTTASEVANIVSIGGVAAKNNGYISKVNTMSTEEKALLQDKVTFAQNEAKAAEEASAKLAQNNKSISTTLASIKGDTSSTFGTKTYVPLSVIPGLTDSANSTVTMRPFLQLLFKWGIAIAVLLSIVMITFGGFQYMTTDAVYDKSEGRAKINAAIVGLLLALSAWLILQTVDPRIVQDPQSKILN